MSAGERGHSCSNCGAPTENEPQVICDACDADDRLDREASNAAFEEWIKNPDALAQLKAANAKLEAVRACCAVPDGYTDNCIFEKDVPEPYVLVSTLQRVLEGAT